MNLKRLVITNKLMNLQILGHMDYLNNLHFLPELSWETSKNFLKLLLLINQMTQVAQNVDDPKNLA